MNTNNNPAVIDGTAGGSHVTDGPLTTVAAREGSPSLLRSSIDERIVQVRPMSTPVDQISRMIGARPARSMKVEYYQVDTKPVQTTAKGAMKRAGDKVGELPVLLLQTANDAMFAATETLLLPGVDAEQSASGLVLYVLERMTDGTGLRVLPVNFVPKSDTDLPEVNNGTTVVRMGRGASELDVQTAQFEALPVKDFNYCQIFKAQVEQSTYMKLSAKEVGWTFSDQEEVAIMDMRMGMEKNFLFGCRARLTDPVKYDEVLLTGGIWNQAGIETELPFADLAGNGMTDLMRLAFTGDAAGSTRKIFLAGSGMIGALNNMPYTKVINATDTVTRWGIDFNELRSKFGTLYVIHSEVFDQCGHENDGLIIDPQYLTKYTHVPFKVERLDLKKSGVRNTDALVATEASCMVLRHPGAHVRVIGSF